MFNLTFMFIFLPIMGAIFFVIPVRFRSICLLASSIIIYGYLQPWYIMLMLGDVWLCFKLAPIIAGGGKSGRLALYGAVATNIGLLIVASALNQIYRVEMPVGLLIYTLTSLGYLLDIRAGEASVEASFVDFGVMCCFFPKLFAGPLVSYNETIKQIKSLNPTIDDVGQGLGMYIRGIAKKIIIADSVMALFLEIKAFPLEEITVISAWALVICATFSTYFTLSATCDIAIGLGRIFGLKLPKNFYYPFEAATVGDFFGRFNITVSSYIKKYVYVKLGSETGGILSASLNVMLISMLMALWYGLRPNLLIWGTVLGLFMILETVIFPKQFKVIPQFYSKIYTFVITFFSFAIFAGDSISQSLAYLAAMFGFGTTSLFDDKILYLLNSNYLLLIVSLFAATSLVSRTTTAFRNKLPRFGAFASAALDIALLALTVGFML